MSNYEIPKKIKSKPTIAGLEPKELLILLIGAISVFTFFREMVHGILVIPFLVIAIGALLWSVMPSKNNPQMKNYVSLKLLFKRDKYSYHAYDHHQMTNQEVIDGVQRKNKEVQ